MAVNIPVNVNYDQKAIKLLQQQAKAVAAEAKIAAAEERKAAVAARAAAREAKEKARSEREAVKATREQIKNHRTVLRLTKQLNNELDKQSKKRTGGGLAAGVRGGILQAGAVAGVGFGISEIISQRNQAIELAQTQLRVEAQLNAAIASTGNTAGFTADQYKQMASDLQAVTNIGDESVIAVQAQLLTFNQLGQDSFPRATRAVLDYATAMNSGATPSMEELRGFATQVGKALQDPEKGLTALARTGVSFTQDQQDLIKSLVATNRTAEAQAIILGELEKQYGGSAEAAREADGGAQALANSWGDLLEQVGRLTMANESQNSALGASIDLVNSYLDPLNDYRDLSAEVAQVQFESAGSTVQNIVALTNYIPLMGDVINEVARWTASEEELAQAQANLAESQVAVNEAAQETATVYADTSEALEEAKKRSEEYADTQRDFALGLIEVEEQLGEDIADVRSDWLEQHQEDTQKHLEAEQDIWDDYKDTIEDINKDLAKSTAKIQKDSSKSLQKVDKDLSKDIAKAQKKAAQDSKAERKKEQVDAMADQRLFDFQLKQLAAEGDAAAIQEALERRAIEQQVEKEQAAVETEIEKQKESDKIQELKDAAAERKMEIEAERQERIAELEAQAEEERQLAEERRAEELEAERQASMERVQANKEERLERIANLEEESQETIAKLGERFVLMEDLTRKELDGLTQIAERAGEEFGEAFSSGIGKGVEKEGILGDLLGSGSNLALSSSFGGTPDAFQSGGAFTVGGSGGPDSQFVGFRASPGEQITISPNITNNIQGAGLDQLVGMINGKVNGAINAALQEYTDDILGPALL